MTRTLIRITVTGSFLYLVAASIPGFTQLTNCYKAAGQMFCNTTPSFDIGVPSEAERRANELSQRQSEAIEQARIAQANRQYVRSRVGQLINNRDCPNAKAMALHNGEIELASQVDRLCVSQAGSSMPGQSDSNEWWAYHMSGSRPHRSVWYVDRKSLQAVSRDIRRGLIAVVQEAPTSNEAEESLTLHEVDCPGRRFRVLHDRKTSFEGKTTEFPMPSDWQTISEGSSAELIGAGICDDVQAKRLPPSITPLSAARSYFSR